MDLIKIAQEVLEVEANELLTASKNIDSSIEKAVELVLNCKGKLIITGVGKSGLVGAKMAATLASTGTSSFYLHPTEAMHGDLGMIGPNDIVLGISYSGESEELVQILPHLKRFDIPLIAMARNPKSSLGKYADVFIDISVNKEACPLGAAPTSSTTLTMAMGDALAVCLMEKRGFKKEDFASFHPGGSLGKQLFVKISDLMRTEDLPIVSHETSLQDAILKMSEGRVGAVLITDENNKLLALLSDGDLRRALMKEDFDINNAAIEYATKNPKQCHQDGMLASDALAMIEEHKIQMLILVDENQSVKGILHIHDLVEAGIK